MPYLLPEIQKGPPLVTLCILARPERFELPTTWFEARYSIQLSYGRVGFRASVSNKTLFVY